MTVALVANIARPISSAISTAFSADSYGALSSYGLIGGSTNPDAVITDLFASGEQGAWYDPSDLSTMFQDSAGTTPVTADGQPVGLILDKSGRNNHASQATAAARPLYKTDGTYHWLQFDGVDDSLSTAAIDFTATDKMSVFSGITRNNNVLSIPLELSSSFNANNGTFVIISGDDAITVNGYTSKARGTINTTLGGYKSNLTPPNTSVLSSNSDISGDLTTLRVNAVAATNGTQDKGTGNFGNFPLYIGARASSSLHFNSNLYSLIVRGALSTTQEITDTETWVAGKTGISLP